MLQAEPRAVDLGRLGGAAQLPRQLVALRQPGRPERMDYRDVPAVTIDDEATLEIDDAISLKREGDTIIVGIHIADVSAFVEKGDPLDIEAFARDKAI